MPARFPDTAQTWRHLLPGLARAGYRAVAPFMRGYAPSALAPDGSYQLGALVADATALHEALGGDGDAVLIGHDWGAEVAYGAAALEPDRWRRLVTLAVPPSALDGRIFSDYDQLKRLFYVYFFRTDEADAVVAADEMRFLDRLWADWSPGYDAAVDLAHTKRALADPANLSAALAYYRAEHAAIDRVPPQPALYLHGDRDGCIDIAIAAEAPEHLAPGSRLERVHRAGHFLHLERPDAVNERILDWLAS